MGWPSACDSGSEIVRARMSGEEQIGRHHQMDRVVRPVGVGGGGQGGGQAQAQAAQQAADPELAGLRHG